MKFFGENVKHNSTSSEFNVLQVENFEEIFFGVYEIEINKTKYLTEKVSEHEGNPIVSVPVVVRGEQIFYPFVLSKGKQEVIFNEETEVLDMESIQKVVQYTPVQEVELSPIFSPPENYIISEPVDDQKNIPDDTIQPSDNFIFESDDKSSGFVANKLFDENVKIITSKSSHNILQVENFEEIFFGVYEIEINKTKYLTEKISTYEGCPVVSVPVMVDSDHVFYPFILLKGKQEIIFNNKNNPTKIQEIYSPEIEHIPDDNLEILSENDVVKSGENIDQLENNKYKILQQIKDAKVQAKLHLAEAKRRQLKAIQTESNHKEDKLFQILESARAQMVEEFIQISKNIKDELLDANNNHFGDIENAIDNKIQDLANSLRESLINDFENSSTSFELKLKDIIKGIHSTIHSKIDKKIDDISIQFVEKVSSIEDRLDKNIDIKLKKKADLSLIKEVKNEISNIQKENVELNDTINRGVNKALSRVGNINNKIDELTISLFEEVESKTTDKVSQLSDVVYDKLDDALDKKIEKHLSNKADSSTVDEVVKKISSVYVKSIEINEKTTKTINKTVNGVSSRVDSLKDKIGDVSGKVDLLDDKIGNLHDTLQEESEKLGKVADKVDYKADLTIVEGIVTKVSAVEQANIELNDTINKGVKKALTRVGNIDSRVDELAIALFEEVESKIYKAEENITIEYNRRLEMLEEKTFDITEQTRKSIIELVNDSKNDLIKELRQIKNEKPIEYVIESKGKKETKDFAGIKKDWDKEISDKIGSAETRLRRYISVYSGGGSVAMQFASGGTMGGNLTVVGTISANQYLGLPGGGSDDIMASTKVRSSSANWDEAYTTVQANSSLWYNLNWIDMINSWTIEPTLNVSIVGGDVYDYTYGTTTYYRFVPSPYNSVLDTFYESFSNPTLSNLITRRGNSR